MVYRGKHDNVKKIDNGFVSANFDATIIFPIDGWFGAIRKLDSRSMIYQEKHDNLKIIDNGFLSAYFDATIIFPIDGWFGAIRKLDSRSMVYHFYIFINSNLTKTENRTEKSLTQLPLVKVLILPKKSKSRRSWYRKVYLQTLHICVYLHTKF